MKKPYFLFTAVILFLGLNLYAQEGGFPIDGSLIDTSLNGNWIDRESGIVLSMDNGIFTFIMDDEVTIMGTYTTAGGVIQKSVTHYFGGFFNLMVNGPMLDEVWYSLEEFTISLGGLLSAFGMNAKEIEELLDEFIELNVFPAMQYSLTENSIIFTYEYEGTETGDVYYRL